MDLSKRVNAVTEEDLKNWIIEIITTACRDMGASLSDEENIHLYKRIYQSMMGGDKRTWMLSEFVALLDSGVRSQYDKKPTSKFTIVVWYAWLDQYNKSRAARHMQMSLAEQAEKRNTTAFELNNETSIFSKIFFLAFNIRTAYGVKYADKKGLKELVEIYRNTGETGLRDYYKSIVSHSTIANEKTYA